MPEGQYRVKYDVSLFTDFDSHLFKEGNHFHIYEQLGAHLIVSDGEAGCYFAVWAPNAERVSVVGDFNGWNADSHMLKMRPDGTGVWEGFISNIKKGVIYKYHIVSKFDNYRVDKLDPYALYTEQPPHTAGRIWELEYKWNDETWMKKRKENNSLNSPMSIYELHIGSWKRVPEENNRFLTYRELAVQLTEYLKEMAYTHVEFMPVAEHPYYPSWGYQTGAYYAPSSRYGEPQDFMFLVDYLHQNDIGVIIDWVPSHFPQDEHCLSYFDGTHLYEHADTRIGFHPEWKSNIFNYGRNEIRNFLISNAVFWLDKYHIDGLRVDAVASMLYLDYARQNGEWLPNDYGGKENIKAINFLRAFNQTVYANFPDVQTIAEESTAWGMVSRPVDTGGLGFGMKWNMGWMHDTLEYASKDPLYKKYHHNQLTFSIWYAFYENFILPLSHDEVVHGKGSLFRRMPGDEWQKFANLRLLFGYMYTHPGKKLLFMGGEFAQSNEWYHETSLDWHLLQYAYHHGMQKWVRALNDLYRKEPALYELDFESSGFQWINFGDWENSTISYIRKGKTTRTIILAVCNFTPVARQNYKIGVPIKSVWSEVLNSDNKEYGGHGTVNPDNIESRDEERDNMHNSISLNLPPLGIVILKGKAALKK